MRKDFGAKPITYPQPVYMIGTYDEEGRPNLMNAAWGGISGVKEISFFLSKGNKTVKNLKKTEAFTVSPAIEDYMVASDYVGIESANDAKDKFEKSGFHAVKSEKVNAPIIKELPLCLECRLISYDDDTNHLRGEIVNVSVDESILDQDGNIDVKALKPISFDPANNSYYGFGEKVGDAFSAGKELK